MRVIQVSCFHRLITVSQRDKSDQSAMPDAYRARVKSHDSHEDDPLEWASRIRVRRNLSVRIGTAHRAAQPQQSQSRKKKSINHPSPRGEEKKQKTKKKLFRLFVYKHIKVVYALWRSVGWVPLAWIIIFHFTILLRSSRRAKNSPSSFVCYSPAQREILKCLLSTARHPERS
jgi:hypothetical protein